MITLNISIIIPAYNEERTIGRIINGCKKYGEVLVVLSSKSTDRTREIAESLGIKIIIDNGIGKGDAMRFGIKEATGDILVFIDADGSHIPEDIPNIIEHIKNDTADMVIASRMTGGSEELHGDINKFFRLFESMMIALIINYRFNVRITDSQNGFRTIKKSVAEDLDLKADSFDIETEMTMKCIKKGYKIKEVPSRELARKYGKSGINLWKMWYKYVWRVFTNLI